MPRLGMDVDAVESAGRALKVQADRVDGIIRALDRTVKALGPVWEGATARRFIQQTWPGYRAQLSAAREHIAGLGQSALNNASEQRRTSKVSSGSTGASATNRAPLAATTTDLVRRVRDYRDDGYMHIDEVEGADGATRYVVFIDGTHGSLTDFDFRNYLQDHGWAANALASMDFDTASKLYIERRMEETLVNNPNAEVMIVGYSQGGIIAQGIANDDRFNVKEVLTMGSPPIATLNHYGGANVVRLAHNSDEVVNGVGVARAATIGLGAAGVGFVANGPLGAAIGAALGANSLATAITSGDSVDGSILTFRSGTDHESGGAHDIGKSDSTDYHGHYEYLATSYDESSDPSVVAARERQQEFLSGTVAGTAK